MGRPRPAPLVPIEPDAAGCADERIRFLTTEPATSHLVRPAILASWRRSRESGVAADRVEVPYVRDPDVDNPLTRSAEPVLQRLGDRLHGTPISIILTDPRGLVLRRRTDDTEFERRLDRVLLAPGFTYAERFAGTNGIGTALESGRATQVLGHEHYAENLETFACAAGPIRDPGTGRVAGVVNLTCQRGDADGLLLTLAETAAEQIEQALAETIGRRELDLLRAYRKTCARSGGAVIAVAADTVMFNDRARVDFDAADQATLIGVATDAALSLPGGRRRRVTACLASGVTARLHVQRVGDTTPPALVADVRVDDGAARATAAADDVPVALPGLVGGSARWRQASAAVLGAVRSGRWTTVHGEPGVGKLALLRAALHRAGRRAVVVDACGSAGLSSIPADADALVITHADRLHTSALDALVSRLRSASPAWVGVTAATAGGELTALCPAAIEIPPLRLRGEDVAVLVPYLLDAAAHGRHVEFAPEALRLLVRASWPGNVAELRATVHELVKRSRSGRIEVADLPPELHSTSPRVLTALESIERDALVRALADANGNKVQASRLLGISRATVYRKIHEYGIVTAR